MSVAQSTITMIPTGRRNDQVARSVTIDAEQSVPGSAANETPLIAKNRQQHESRDQRTDRRPTRIKQRRNPSAVHPVSHTRLDLSCNTRKQDARQQRDREHQCDTQNRDLPPAQVEHAGRHRNQFARKK